MLCVIHNICSLGAIPPPPNSSHLPCKNMTIRISAQGLYSSANFWQWCHILVLIICIHVHVHCNMYDLLHVHSPAILSPFPTPPPPFLTPVFTPLPTFHSLPLPPPLHCHQGAIALCEMVEFYGCTSKLNLAHNHRLRPRAWLTIGRMLKKVLSGVEQ